MRIWSWTLPPRRTNGKKICNLRKKSLLVRLSPRASHQKGYPWENLSEAMSWNGQKIWKNRLIWAGLVYHSSFHCASDVLERSTHHSTNHCKQKWWWWWWCFPSETEGWTVGPSSNQPSSRQVASRTRHPGQIWRADGEKQHLAACLWSGWLTSP